MGDTRASIEDEEQQGQSIEDEEHDNMTSRGADNMPLPPVHESEVSARREAYYRHIVGHTFEDIDALFSSYAHMEPIIPEDTLHAAEDTLHATEEGREQELLLEEELDDMPVLEEELEDVPDLVDDHHVVGHTNTDIDALFSPLGIVVGTANTHT